MAQDQHGRLRQRSVTLHDVADMAEVSTSTVSRILDDRHPESNSVTARRVRHAASALGYQRDLAAASLRLGKTMTIGVVVPRLTDTVMAMLYEAIAHACQRSGKDAVVATTDDEPNGDRAAAEALLQRRVDGLIVCTARLGGRFPEDLAARGVPYVLAVRTDGRSLSAVGDDRLGGYLATRHLLDLGHRRVGMITGPSYASTARGRLEGYQGAMTDAGVDVNPAWVAESTFGIESGADAAEVLMSLAERPTAVFAANDNTAIGALAAFQKLGISVPSDVSLVGYNDTPIVSRLPVPLTSVRVPFDEIAAAALDLLESGQDGRNDRVRVARPTLVARRSSARASV